MNDLSDREFGDYHIIRRIGSGTTADVFLAEQRSLGRCVALKILKKELAHDKTYLNRFVREAKAIAALNHPSLVQIYQTDCLDGYWFIAQEYVQGETLQQEIQRSGALPIQRVVDILWQIASAFETAAESGIVHRDIKPENILLGHNGVVKVTDFGLAHVKISADRSHLALTEVGMTLGTPLYMSPEQAQGHKLDHRSDIYSLGITCWHALTGKPPFMGGTALSVALQHVNNQPPPLLKQRSGIPLALAAIIERMIEKKPENRFQSFHNVLQELQASGMATDKPVIVPRSGAALQSARQALQRTLEQRRTRIGRIISIFVGVVILSLLGWSSGYAYRTWINPPFVGELTQEIPRKPTIEEQWVYACFVDTPDVWQAVIDYFPEKDIFWERKARRQLVRYYFSNGDRDNCFQQSWQIVLFGNLYGDLEEQVLGLAGSAWGTVHLPDAQISQNYLSQIDRIELINSFPMEDRLTLRILDDVTRTLRQKSSETPTNDESSP